MDNIAVKEKKMRDSGVELLKVIAIFLIVLFHCQDTAYYMVNSALGDISKLPVFDFVSMIYIHHFGLFGDIIFVACSAWFLLDSKRTKAEKIINLLLDSTLISIIILCAFIASGTNVSKMDMIRNVLPDLFYNNWFIPVYALFYAIHPLLNAAIKTLNSKSHLAAIIICFFLFGLLSFLEHANTDNVSKENFAPEFNYLICFVVIYLFVAYVKLYSKAKDSVKFNLIVLILSLIGASVTWIVFHYLNKRQSFIKLTILSLSSPFLIVIAVCLLNLFRKMTFKSKIVNYLSSLSLFVYVSHENALVRKYLRGELLQKLFNKFGMNKCMLSVFILAIAMFAVCIALSAVYRQTLHVATKYASKKIKKIGCAILNKTENVLNILRNK